MVICLERGADCLHMVQLMSWKRGLINGCSSSSCCCCCSSSSKLEKKLASMRHRAVKLSHICLFLIILTVVRSQVTGKAGVCLL